MQEQVRLAIPSDLEPEAFVDRVATRFPVLRESTVAVRRSYYDTFDWRLFRRGLVLSREGRHYDLRPQGSAHAAETAVCSGDVRPRFWRDFPPGRLRDQLVRHISVRSLLHLATVEGEVQNLRLLDARGKTVLRFALEQAGLGGHRSGVSLPRAVVLLPVRGYPKELKKFRSLLRELGITNELGDLFLSVMKAADIRPGSYTSKLNLALQPDQRARDAVRRILEHLLRILRQNEAGIRADIDTEFLHDFRVATRRTRSALTQIKGVFPLEETGAFKADFAHLGSLSNRLRDLDVYLQSRDHYRSLLPESLIPGLDPLVAHFTRQRDAEHRAMIKTLDGVTYRGIVTRWSEFLRRAAREELEASENSDIPIVDLACRFISKQHRKVLKIGKRIDRDSPAGDLHRLRIEGKKLRYLLEFFASLFPPKEMTLLIKHLKRLQDNLGDFNDLVVQQKALENYLQGLKPTAPDSSLQAAAIGGLLTGLHLRQNEVRRDIGRTFRRFGKAENRSLYRTLFESA